jgi:Tfp pilus assembly protein PilN
VKPVNLIPQEQRRRTATDSGGPGAPIVIGVLAVLLAMVVGYVLTTNKVNERKAEAASVSAEADQVEAQAAQQTSYTSFAQIAATRMQSVSGVAATRFDWERFMRELSRVMPTGSWLQSADASVLGDPTDSGATSTETTTTTTTTIQPAANLVGCTPDQDDVARMMVRLRELYRVEDVVLNESLAGTTSEKPSFDACGRLYTFNLTVKFSAAPPATEAPRGSDSVPASLGGGS